MNLTQNSTGHSKSTSSKVGLWNCLREWLTKNKIFFETVAAVLLSGMAIYISLLQHSTAKIQTDVAKAQLSQQRKETAITSARDWAALRELLQPIIEKYPALGEIKISELKNLSRERKIDWLSEMETLVSSLGKNPILIASQHNYDRYLSMLGDLRIAKKNLLTRNDQHSHNIFYQVSDRIGEHATSMWWDMGMERGSRSPRDNIFEPTTPNESIFQKGFPWENEIRKRDIAQPAP